MSYWTFSDVFEEQGVVRRPFYGGFGLISAGGIPKPAFNAFKMLHRLGLERLDTDSPHALITRRTDGTLVIALWNYTSPGAGGLPTTMTLRLPDGAVSARLLRLDADHGNAAGEYARMGSPKYPTAAQLQALIKAAALPAAEELPIRDGRASVVLPPDGLATVEVTLTHP